MTLIITDQMKQAYEEMLETVVDYDMIGNPIKFRSTMPEHLQVTGFVPFCHGFQAGYDFGYMKGACDEHNS